MQLTRVEVQSYLDETERAAREKKMTIDFTPVRQAAKRWERNARASLQAARKAIESGDSARVERIHKGLMKVERALLDEQGLAGRPWFKHLIYAPRPTYKALVFPALTEAIEAGDRTRQRRKLNDLRVPSVARQRHRTVIFGLRSCHWS